MVEYKKIFLSKIESLLSYFVKFFNNRSVLSKVYLDNYVVERSDLRAIIIIIYDKSTFFTNNDC